MSEKRFAKPQEIADAKVAFPANVSGLMPAYADIPREFKPSGSSPWADWQARWFFSGLESFPAAKDGIDQQAALRHLSAIQRSFAPKHEHKAAAVAYLASLWLVSPEGVK
jgi:hypothetical protein